MPKRAAGLTARKVETIKAPGLFADGNGLYLQVSESGAKSWIFRYSFASRRRDMGLGPIAVLSLADARQRVSDARKLIVAGTDPIEARKASVAATAIASAKLTTFKEAAEAYVDAKRPGWKNQKHIDQWDSTLAAYVYPKLGHLPVAAIDTPLVLQVIEPIWSTKTETANRIRGRIEMILDHARVRGYRTGDNPARWRGHLDHTLPARADVAKAGHHAALPYSEMPAFWPRLQLHDGIAARALEYAILCATRTTETIGARWPEIDLKASVWTIPSERMKAGIEHRVPLSPQAVTLLRKLEAIRQGDAVFPGNSTGGHLSNMAMAMTLRRLTPEATPHGFRSTFRTWAAEKTQFPDAVGEAALAHVIGDRTVAAYQRGDLFEKRRKLMAQWADYCEGKAGGKMLPMKRRG